MIIKAMKLVKDDIGTQESCLIGNEIWEIYDNISDFQHKVYKENENRNTIYFKYNEVLKELKITDYEKIFIMNDNGKTIETLRHINREYL